MIKQKDYYVFGLVVLLLIIFVSGCVQQENKIYEKGFLEGKIIIGPICPVERFPPDPKCQPTEETYKAWPIAIWTTDKKTKIAQIGPKLDGTYRMELPIGIYVIDLEKQQHFGSKDLPATVTINSAETTKLEIDIDTGIR